MRSHENAFCVLEMAKCDLRFVTIMSRSQCLMVDVQASRFGHMKKIDIMFRIKIIFSE